MNKLFVIVICLIISSPSYAYLGPGLGGGVIASIIGFIAAILLGLCAILYYPIKRALKNRKQKNNATDDYEKDK